jgi:hypothetical protein
LSVKQHKETQPAGKIEVFTATKCSKVFSGDQPYENGVVLTSTLMMEAETVSETVDYNSIFARLIAREGFIITCFNL